MNCRAFRVSLFTVLATLASGSLLLSAEVEFRVGIQVYNKKLTDDEVKFFGGIFHSLKQDAFEKHDTQVRIRAASGSYRDLVDWCRRDQVDVAVVTPRVASLILDERDSKWEYLCTMGQQDENSPTGVRFDYQIRCIVPVNSPLAGATEESSWDTFREHFKNGMKLVMVDRSSASGYFIPRKVMAKEGIAISREDSHVGFSGGHSESVNQILEASTEPGDPDVVAFVWHGATEKTDGGKAGRSVAELESSHSKPQIFSVPLPGLTSENVPENAVIVRRDLMQNEEMANLLRAIYKHDPKVDPIQRPFTNLGEFRESYKIVRESGGDPEKEIVEQDSADSGGHRWDELAGRLTQFEEQTGRKPRVALVLAGGGAKCAFQVGAIGRLTETLRDKGHDISLVVGTSGGAFNALPVALGLYDCKARKNKMSGAALAADLWKKLDARDVVKPSREVQMALGGLLFTGHAVLILIFVRIFAIRERRACWVIRIALAIGVGQILTHTFNLQFPWDILLENPMAYVVWAFMTSGILYSGCLLIASAALTWWLERRSRQNNGEHLVLSLRSFSEVIAGLTFIFLLAAGGFLFGAARHFSDARPLVNEISRTLTAIVNARVEYLNLDGDNIDQFVPASEESDTVLGELSTYIFDKKLLTRDLIVAATQFDTPEAFKDNGIFFYASPQNDSRCDGYVECLEGRDDTFPPAESVDKFHDLSKGQSHQKELVDVVIGSGAVFPVFPPRNAGLFGPLIDGSFSHHRPVQAALDWGATHIIVIDPSAQSKLDPERRFIDNVGLALQHLFEQAQSEDKHVLRHADVMFFRPKREPDQVVTLLSFAEGPIGNAIKKAGEEDAPMRFHVRRPQFVKALDTKSMVTPE